MISIEIKKLFGKFDYKLEFNKKLNILIGENGCGKSTILRIINYVFNDNYLELSKIAFSSIELVYSNKNISIKHEDLEQIDYTSKSEFRIYMKELLNKDYSDFESFFYEIKKFKRVKTYDTYINNQDNLYSYDVESYIEDDQKIFNMTGYIEYMKECMCVYGSKKYFEKLFNFLKKTHIKNSMHVYLYSLVDLINIESIKLNKRAIKECSQLMPDKIFKIKDKKISIFDRKTKEIILFDNLSSGEKKMMALYSLISNTSSDQILILDEPELSLSIYWQQKLIEYILKRSKAQSVIIASQSPNLLTYEQLEYMVPMFLEVD